MENNETIDQLLGGEPVNCYCCGASLNEKTPEEIFIDPWFLTVLAVVFCTQECRDAYIDSK
jgi:hypothetical protein